MVGHRLGAAARAVAEKDGDVDACHRRRGYCPG
jgi:hypothetical protein